MLKLAVLCIAVAGAFAAGGWRDADTTGKKIQSLVDFAATQLNAMSNSILLRKVTMVTKAQEQLVNGHNYKIEFVFGQSMCTKYSTPDQLDDCQMYTDMDQACEVKIYESFSGEKELKDFSCKQETSKRALRGGVTGGLSEEKEKNQEYLDIALRVLSMSNPPLTLTDVNLTSVRTQVVSGMKYYLKVEGRRSDQKMECKLEVWSRPWLAGSEGFKPLYFKCRDVDSSQKRAMVAGGCAGCVSEEVANPDVYMDLLQKATGLSKTSEGRSIVKILSVKTQVVAGIKYFMKVEISEDGKSKMCDVSFVDAPWMSSQPINVQFDC